MIKRCSLIVVAVLYAALLITPSIQAESEKPGKTVYFLVHSGACPCQKQSCQVAEPLATRIKKNLADGIDFMRIDYGERPEKVQPLLTKYKLFVFPVILVVDSQGNEIYKAQGRLDYDEVSAKLKELGVVRKEGS